MDRGHRDAARMPSKIEDTPKIHDAGGGSHLVRQ
jgi:hypothetical protein